MNLRAAWKLWSVKLAAVVAILAGLLAGNQSIALGLIYFLPDGPWRVVIAIAVSVIVFVIPTITRMWQQPKLRDTDEPPCDE